jgi:hypothetical protein
MQTAYNVAYNQLPVLRKREGHACMGFECAIVHLCDRRVCNYYMTQIHTYKL